MKTRKQFIREIVAVTTGVLVAIGLGMAYIAYTNVSTATDLGVQPKLAHVGDLVQSTGYTLTVKKVSTDAVGDAYYIPGTDYQFLITDINITNTGSNDFFISPVVQFSLQDDQGNIYRISPSTTETPLESGSLVAGGESHGVVSFEVPKSATGLMLIYNPAPLRATVASVSL